MSRIAEHDEFLLSQLLDGDLSAGEAETLQARFAREPELRSAFEAMQRLDTVLQARRGREAAVNLDDLRGDIMDAVEASRRPSIIRFPLWTWAAGAMAAAAAIALVFVINRPAAPVPNSGQNFAHGPATPPVVVPNQPNEPSVSEKGRLLVQFNRPRDATATPAVARVSFSQSTELANAMKARDEERLTRPSWLYVSQRVKSRATPAGTSPYESPL